LARRQVLVRALPARLAVRPLAQAPALLARLAVVAVQVAAVAVSTTAVAVADRHTYKRFFIHH
jgi:hypothetical protein